MEELLRMWRGREFQVVGAATAKLREPKRVWTCGTANKLQSDERSLQDGADSLRSTLPAQHVWPSDFLCCWSDGLELTARRHALLNKSSQSYGVRSVTCHMGWHSVTCHPTQVNTPHLNLSQTGWYLIYLPWRIGRLSWPRWPVIYRDGLPRSPSKY